MNAWRGMAAVEAPPAETAAEPDADAPPPVPVEDTVVAMAEAAGSPLYRNGQPAPDFDDQVCDALQLPRDVARRMLAGAGLAHMSLADLMKELHKQFVENGMACDRLDRALGILST